MLSKIYVLYNYESVLMFLLNKGIIYFGIFCIFCVCMYKLNKKYLMKFFLNVEICENKILFMGY